MEKSKDFLTGVVFFGLLAILAFFTIILSGLCFGSKTEVTVLFDTVAGLEEGNSVRVDGQLAGQVKTIERPLDSRKIRVTLEFDGTPVIYEGAQFQVASSSLLGGKLLDVVNPDISGPPLSLDRDVNGVVAPDPIAQAGKLFSDENIESLTRAVANLEATTVWLKDDGAAALAEIRSVIGDVKGFTPALARDGAALLEDLRLAAADVRLAAADIRTFTPALAEGGPALIAELRDVVADVKGFTPALESDGTRALQDIAAAAAEAKALASDLRRVTAQLSPDKGIGRLIASDEPWRRLEQSLASVERASMNIEMATAALGRKDNLVEIGRASGRERV